MGAPYTLSQLLTAQTLDEAVVQYLALLQAGGFPAITEWATEPTGVEMTFVQMVCRALNQLAGSGAPEDQRIASIAAGRHLAWARGGWLDILAEQFYRVPRNQATRTTFTMTLLSVPAAQPNQFQPGDLWLVGPSGRRYQSSTGGDLEPGGQLAVSFAAEDVGSAFADDPSRVTVQLVTAPAGVTLSPTAGDFSIVSTAGSSTGRLHPVRTIDTVVPTPHTFAIEILESGDVGAATFALQVDGGPFSPAGLLLASNVLPGGTTVNAIAGGESPSFVEGDVFVFSTPGTPNYVQGDDEEGDDSLARRCRDRWPAQSLNVMDGKVKLWVTQAYPSVNRIQVAPDTVTPGRFIVTVADSHGSVDQAALDTIEAYVKPRLGEGEDMGAATPTNLFVFARGNVKVSRATSAEALQEIQAAADEAWRKYVSATDIGPSDVKKARLVDILIEAGAIDVDLATLVLSAGGVDWPINVEVGTGMVPVVGDLLARTMTWGFA